MLILSLSAFLGGAVIYDLISRRIPNLYLAMGLILALILNGLTSGWLGLMSLGGGFFVGLAMLLPFYVMGGMAAGDVKLMAVVGGFVGLSDVLLAGAYSLIAGGFLGVLYLICKGHFGRLLMRCWAMATLHSYIPAEDGDAARHRFPYAIAIATGTLLSLYWTPI